MCMLKKITAPSRKIVAFVMVMVQENVTRTGVPKLWAKCVWCKWIVPSSERSVIGGLSGTSKLSVYGTILCNFDDSGPSAVCCLKARFRKRSTIPPKA
jgi:hypothetical protein